LKNLHEILPETAELIDGCLKGIPQFQDKLYQTFAAKMFGVCLRYTSTKEDAEDLLQEGFIRAFGSLKNYKYEGSFEGWIRRIFVHTCIEVFRKKSKMYPMIELIENYHSSEKDDTLNIDIHANDLMKMVQSLSPGYKIIFNMFAIDGYSHKEIAEHLGITEGTSKSQMARARMVLQKMIQHENEKIMNKSNLVGHGK
jgi:RNA polymerase sigma factor (sigma-70 family)